MNNRKEAVTLSYRVISIKVEEIKEIENHYYNSTKLSVCNIHWWVSKLVNVTLKKNGIFASPSNIINFCGWDTFK